MVIKNIKEEAFCWIFNIGIEKEWTQDKFCIKNEEEESVIQHMDEILLLLAGKQDIVILRKMPEKNYMDQLEKLGFNIPRILCPQKEDCSRSITELILEDELLLSVLKAAGKQESFYLVPYGITEKEEKLGELCYMKLIGSKANVVRERNSKLYARRLAESLDMPCPTGFVCDSTQEIKNAWEELMNVFSKVVIKRLYGASGQGLYLVDKVSKLKRILYLTERAGNGEEIWIVEGWYDDKVDLNTQLFLHEDGNVEIISVTEQILKDTVYRGSAFPVSASDEKLKQYRNQMLAVGAALYQDGVRGVVGIDSIISADTIYPVIEINVRFTLSTYLSQLSRLYSNYFFQSMYYKISLCDGLEWTEINKKLAERKIYFDGIREKGVFCYNNACMSRKSVGGIGRLFAVAIAKQRDEVKVLIQELEEIIEGVQGKRGIRSKNKEKD